MAYQAASKASVLQTAFNNAYRLVSAMVAGGFFEDPAHIPAAIEEHKALQLAQLEAARVEDQANAPAPRSSGGYNGGSSNGGGNLDPSTLKLGDRYKKHAGKTLAEVQAVDPSYVQWLAGYGRDGQPGCKNNWMNTKARAFLAQAGVSTAATQPDGYLPN